MCPFKALQSLRVSNHLSASSCLYLWRYRTLCNTPPQSQPQCSQVKVQRDQWVGSGGTLPAKIPKSYRIRRVTRRFVTTLLQRITILRFPLTVTRRIARENFVELLYGIGKFKREEAGDLVDTPWDFVRWIDSYYSVFLNVVRCSWEYWVSFPFIRNFGLLWCSLVKTFWENVTTKSI